MELRDVLDYGDEESQKELEAVYGPTIMRWDDIEIWDDVVTKEEKAIVSELEGELLGSKCPHLKKLDNYFYYCEKRVKEIEKIEVYKRTYSPEFWSSQYNSKASHFSLQLWCMQPEERHSKCVIFVGEENGTKRTRKL